MCDPTTCVGAVYFYVVVGSAWTLQQTLDGTSDSELGRTLAYNPSGSELAVGAYYTNYGTGMYITHVSHMHVSICIR